MSGFSPDWLALREPADARARDPALTQTLAATLPPARRQPLSVVDLGAGTGANLRYLAPRLQGRQEWLLVEHDPALLATLAQTLGAWAQRQGLACAEADGGLRLRGPALDCRVAWRALDLARQLGELPLPAGGLVTASALLDLVSATWLDALARRCHAAHAGAFFTLTYDGRTTWHPADPEDAAMLAAFNRHQQSDKGFGPALGPRAPLHAEERFKGAGYTVTRAASDWRLDATAGPLQAAIASGTARAVQELDATLALRARAWAARRAARLRRGESRLLVGHQDLYAAPPARQQPGQPRRRG